MQSTQNVNVRATIPLVSPRRLIDEMPESEAVGAAVIDARETVKRILAGEDRRLLVVVGPCSIHDRDAALEYARRLQSLAQRVADRIYIVMRVYFEKPRTTIGWKGLINDPHLNDTFDIEAGLRLARGILLDIVGMGLPVCTELLEPITPQYIADLIALTSIGARTTESPTHRQMASGLSMPVGYKNGTDGDCQTAIDAMLAARTPHSFLGIDPDGKTCVVQTRGNPWGLLVLRGGRGGPNYDAASVAAAAAQLLHSGLAARMLVDCSHANSNKDYRRQGEVWDAVLEQRVAGSDALIGMMIESNLHEGNQPLPADLSQLRYGVSITDGCISWEQTESMLVDAHARLAEAVEPARA